MRTHIALLRGINVSGRNMIKMAELKRLFAELGFEHVETLLQSGNVAFRADGRGCADLEALLARETAERLKVSVPYLVRTAAEWAEVIRENPFPAEALADPSHLLVLFMPSGVDAAEAEAVRAKIQGPERFAVRGRHMYVVYPDGIGNSTVGRTPGWNRLTLAGSARNWNTVLKLDAMLHS